MGLPLRSPVAKLSCEAATEENAKRRSFMPRTQVTGKANFSAGITSGLTVTRGRTCPSATSEASRIQGTLETEAAYLVDEWELNASSQSAGQFCGGCLLHRPIFMRKVSGTGRAHQLIARHSSLASNAIFPVERVDFVLLPSRRNF